MSETEAREAERAAVVTLGMDYADALRFGGEPVAASAVRLFVDMIERRLHRAAREVPGE